MTLSHLFCRGMVERGAKGVGKRPKSDLCMARLDQFMLTRLREMGVRK